MSNSKDKRTKEQILKLLDRAMEQEERLSEKIKSLETDLADCRKKAEDPRHELTEEAMPASKVSFRVDYYRTSDEGPLKGIIEHLPSRQNKSFEGEGQLVISHFMSRFLTEEGGTDAKQKTLAEEKIEPAPLPAKDEKETKPAEKNIFQEEKITTGSQLLQRLRAEFATQSPSAGKQPKATQQQTPSPPQKRSERMERLLSKAGIASSPPPQTAQKKPPIQQPVPSTESKTTPPTQERHSHLLERLLEEHRKNLKP